MAKERIKSSANSRPQDQEKEDISISIDALKGKWHLVLLLLIVLFGAYVRYYHIDYPVIGYHNWKEARYLEEARNFAREGFFEHGFFVATYDYPPIDADSSGAHGGEFPSLSILVGLLFMVFGESLYMARVFTLLIGLGTIVMMYFVVKELFDREDLALVSAISIALMPMLVFFTHNVDVINLGLLLMLAGVYFYVLWVKHDKGRDMILSTIFIMLAAISKYDFLMIGIPMLFIFPWSRLKGLRTFSSRWYPYLISVPIFCLVAVQYFYSLSISRMTSTVAATAENTIDLTAIFRPEWWATIKAYTADNYTILGFFIALLGMAFLLLFFKRKNIGYKFALGYIFGAVLFYIIASDKLQGHSYHQYPLAPFYALMIAYCIVVAATNAANMARVKAIKPIVIIIIFIILYVPSSAAWQRQFDTQFFGLDVAGDYIKTHSMPNERVIHSDHQDYGVLWYADRKGIDGYIPNASEIMRAEKNLNTTWIFAYQWGLNVVKDNETWNYIKENYRLSQMAFMNNQPFYLLFHKGGTFNESMLANMTGKPGKKDYEMTSGKITLQWIDFE